MRKEKIFNNLPLKILAIIIAIVIWVVIINVGDPSTRKTISGISVDLLNEEELEQNEYTYNVISGNSISIVVKGPQSIVNELKASDFYASADLSTVSPLSEAADITVKCLKEDAVDDIDITVKTSVVQLSIDNKTYQDYPVEVSYTGTPAEDYIVGDSSTSPATIRITGAESVVEKIARVVIEYDVSGMNADISEVVSPILYDADGNMISTDNLVLSRSNMNLTIQILPTKWVDVNYAVTGTVKDGYQLIGCTSNLTSIQIAATKDDLAEISSINIPAGIIDVSGLTDNKEYSVQLVNYLTENYIIASDLSELIVTADVEPIITKKIKFNTSQITIDNLDKNLKLSSITEMIGDTSVEISVSGVESELEDVDLKKLDPTIDLTGKVAGTYRVPIKLTASDKYTVQDTYYVQVTLTSANQETTTTAAETDPQDTSESDTSLD